MRPSISIRLIVHGASGLSTPPPPQLQCVAQIEACRLCSAVANTSGAEASTVEWEEELVLEASPEAHSLKLVLQLPKCTRPAQFVAAGSVGLQPLLEGNVTSRQLAMPVVDEVGKHAGQVNCTLSVTRHGSLMDAEEARQQQTPQQQQQQQQDINT
ncbi:hypothetical protein D9Q98_001795 [Chlorella vulgaris]|uniref:C2 domain-containing protein n=1 Tax=Chlorella vulgaris TaxID=3077 RepID=A0A9D4Z0L7_CHLVU|nr:hypothetical protein D9Q98_001795 [Chlorella vulgaris]